MSKQPKVFGSETVWFVTGCSSGLGREIALAVHKSGHRIAATARNVKTLSYLPDDETRVLKLPLDVTSETAIKEAVATTVKKFGRLDVAVNNAGYGLMTDFEGVSEEDARDQIETLFWGPVHVTREVLPIFREVNPKGQGGTVVNISSVGGWFTTPGSAFYHAGKFALEGFMESVAQEVLPEWNISFVTVAPGGVRTNFAGSNNSGLRLPPRHPAYDTESSLLTTLIKYATDPASSETWSDPTVCAQVIIDTVVNQDKRPMPRRLMLGAENLTLIPADIQRTLKEIEDWKDVTVSTSPKGGANVEALAVGK